MAYFFSFDVKLSKKNPIYSLFSSFILRVSLANWSHDVVLTALLSNDQKIILK
jgi:hypothetical protein